MKYLRTQIKMEYIFTELVHEYTLLSIETSLEDYLLAYFLNNALDILLERDREDLIISHKDYDDEYSKYIYIDNVYKTTWHLISNVFVCSELLTTKAPAINLFDKLESEHFLIPELKKTNFFMKIEEFYEEEVDALIEKIRLIPEISKVERIDPYSLKSRDYLIY